MGMNWMDEAKLQSIDQSTLNVMINGKSGSGKTWLACSIAEGIQNYYIEQEAKKNSKDRKSVKVIHFDKEDGAKSRIEIQKLDWYMFKNEKSSLGYIIQILPSILEDPTVKVVMLDTLTGIWRDAQKAHQEYMLEKGKRNSWGDKKMNRYEEGDFIINDWKKIKEAYYEIQNKLVYSDKHLICITRAGDEYDMSDPNKPQKTGELTTKTEGEAKFEFDVFIEMALQENATNPDSKDAIDVYWAKCKKDRWNIINGQIIKFPNFKWVKPHFEKLAVNHNLSYDTKKLNETNKTAFMDDREKTQKQGMEWVEKMMDNSDTKAIFDNYAKALGKTIDDKNRRQALMKYLGDEEAFYANIKKRTDDALIKQNRVKQNKFSCK